MRMNDNFETFILDYLANPKIVFDKSIIEQIDKALIHFQAVLDEESANKFWCLKSIATIQQNYIKLFELLKSMTNPHYAEAWLAMDRISIDISCLRENWPLDDLGYFIPFIADVISQYEILFPYEYFLSRESLIKKTRCSICGNENRTRNKCEHIPGRLYNGNLCMREITDLEFIGFAIVKNPFDKYAVITMPDFEYDYTLLNKVMPYLNSPFDRWLVTVKQRQRKEYAAIKRNDKCPCGSGKKYKNCCLGTKNEECDHYAFTFFDNPTAQPLEPIYL